MVVEHRDRLMRFGFEYVEAALAAQGRAVMVMESSEVQDDLVRDVTEVLTSLCARLYGRSSAGSLVIHDSLHGDLAVAKIGWVA